MGQLPGGLRVSIGNTPQARDDYFAFAEENLTGPLALDVLANDGGGARSLFAVFEGPPPADLSSLLNGYPAPQTSFVSSQTGATISIDADGTVHYDPSTAFFNYESLAEGEQLVETITYVLRLANGAFSVATTTVTIDGAGSVNEAPATTDESVSIDEDTAVNGTVVDNTTDADNDPETELTYSVVGLVPAGLTFNPDGTYVFDPAGLFEYLNDGESAEVSFQYKANDGQADSNVSMVTITVDGVTDAPANNSGIDVVIANLSAASQVLINEGDLNFGFADLPGGPRTSEGIALGDVDDDGDLDVLIANFGNFSPAIAEPNQILINDGSGNFAASDLPGGARYSSEFALGDVDGDGDLDVVVANPGTVLVGDQLNQVLINDGSGNFAASDLPGGAFQSNGIALGDVNGDGDLDIAVANGNNQANQLLLNDGSGGLTPAPTPLPGGSFASWDIKFADMDGDGDLDIVVANALSTVDAPNQLLTNDGNGNFTASDLPGAPARSALGIALGDIDGDGDFDVLVANAGPANELLLNNGDGTFTLSDLPGGERFSEEIALGDMDGDGDLDALIVNALSQPNQLLVNDGDGNFTAFDLPGGNLSSFSVALGDVNGDGAVAPVDANGLPNINLMGYLPEMYETPPII